MKRLFIIPIVAIFAALAFTHCGSSQPSYFGSEGADGGGGGGPDGGDDDGGQSFQFDASGDASPAVTHCSADLHQILDANNNVVSTCPPDQGCGASGCVPACDSAAQNKSTVGCDYLTIAPDSIDEVAGGCFAAFLANTWTTDVSITASYAGKPLNIGTIARQPKGAGSNVSFQPLPGNKLPAGQIAVLFLNYSAGTACPDGITAGVNGTDAATHGTGIGKSFHITTSAPVAAYDVFPFGGSISFAASATLLLPTTSWTTNYVAVAPFDRDQAVGFAQNAVAVVATESGTTVTISPTSPIVGGSGVASTGKGQPHTYNLSAGDVLQFTQDDDLTGSPIVSNKPVGVWAMATCMNIDVDDTACDAAHQEIPPVAALGHEYVAVRYRNRASSTESVPWRIVGAVNGTNLKYSPKTPAGAPTTIGFGKLAEFWDPGPFVVQSQDDQHPFYMSAHMTGQDHQPASGTGDPEFVNVIAAQEFLASYVFYTDVTYADTDLVLVRKDYGQGYKDVNLDCLGVVTGWKPIAQTTYQYANVSVQTNGAAAGKCDNGFHTIKSELPFGLTVWGWDQYVSYAYPAGASVQPVNSVVVPAQPF